MCSSGCEGFVAKDQPKQPKGDGWRKQIVAIDKHGNARPLTKADGSAIDKGKKK